MDLQENYQVEQVNKEDRFYILEQYKIYSDAKERFIDRHFSTNKFYLVLNLLLLVSIHIISILTPQYIPVILLGIIGLSVTVLWWMSIDSYQFLIKIKYAKVLEYMESKLPEQPYHKEYVDYKDTKKRKNLIVFGDLQKVLTVIIMCIYFVICTYNIVNAVKYNIVM